MDQTERFTRDKLNQANTDDGRWGRAVEPVSGRCRARVRSIGGDGVSVNVEVRNRADHPPQLFKAIPSTPNDLRSRNCSFTRHGLCTIG